MKQFIPILCSVLLVAGCAKKREGLVFDRLIGTWRLADSSQYERWKRNMDGTYTSHMFSISGKDTVTTEEVSVFKEGEKWLFKTLVKDQNQGKAVTFTSRFVKDSIVQFENPAHDFPRIISYNFLSENKMLAFIAGSSDTIYFDFTRAGD